MAEVVSKEQFGLFPNKQILDTIGVTKKCIHFINVKKMNTIMLKHDLDKAYEKFN